MFIGFMPKGIKISVELHPSSHFYLQSFSFTCLVSHSMDCFEHHCLPDTVLGPGNKQSKAVPGSQGLESSREGRWGKWCNCGSIKMRNWWSGSPQTEVVREAMPRVLTEWWCSTPCSQAQGVGWGMKLCGLSEGLTQSMEECLEDGGWQGPANGRFCMPCRRTWN